MRNILFNLTPVTSIPILSYFERTLLGLIIFTPNLPATQNIKKKREKKEKSNFAEKFHQKTHYLPEQFYQITHYLAKQFH